MTWNYALAPDKPDLGLVGIAVSDRMITAADVQYEPDQMKVAVFSNALVLVAGDISIHSQAIKDTRTQLRSVQSPGPLNIATIYGRAIQATKLKQAEDLILAPLGLNSDVFLAQQNDMSDAFVAHLREQMQGYAGPDVEAIVVGSDGFNAQIYSVDGRGGVSWLDDVGFAAIGIGAWHAKSRLMQLGYKNGFPYIEALAATYSAKKNAEIAPGVGADTDIHLVFRNSIERLDEAVFENLATTHQLYAEKQAEAYSEHIEHVRRHVIERGSKTEDEKVQQDGAGKGTDSGLGKNPP